MEQVTKIIFNGSLNYCLRLTICIYNNVFLNNYHSNRFSFQNQKNWMKDFN